MKKNKIRHILILFVCIEILFLISVQLYHKNEINKYLVKNTIEFKITYNSIMNSFQLMTDAIVSQVISKPNLMKSYSTIPSLNKDQQKQVRDSLYNLLIPTYEYLKIKKIRQLHFHLPNNESFLRFHRPQKFGDNLTEVRYSVKMTNKYHQKYVGFEEGRIYNGFRFVFPLFYGIEPIGSVETSFSFDAIKQNILKYKYMNACFILKKDIVNAKVFEDENKNYTSSIISPNYMQEVKFLHYNDDESGILKTIDLSIKERIAPNLKENNDFTIYQKINNQYFLASFISIKNVEQKPAAYLIAYSPDNFIKSFILQNILVSLTGFLLLAILAYYIIKTKLKNTRIEEQNAQIMRINNEVIEQYVEITNINEALVKQKIELEEANATKNKFFNIIAHDLKSPFNILKVFSQTLLDKHEEYDVAGREELIVTLIESVGQTFKLLENLLLWSQTQTGKFTFTPNENQVETILFETVFEIKNIAKGKDINLSWKVSENFTIVADLQMVKTIIRNLVTNSIKYTNKGGSVTIEAIKEKTGAHFIISDTGIGMSQEKVDQLFDITQKTSTPGTNNEKGTGLGLIICKEFTEKHNGTIWVESELGVGTKFHFTIPDK